MTDLEKDLAFVFRKHGMLMLRDDGMSVQRLDTYDGYYVCFRPQSLTEPKGEWVQAKVLLMENQ